MKKFGIFILLLATFTLIACSGGYTPKVRVPWGSRKETLTYAITVLPDSGGADGNYNYVPSYDDVDYPAKPVAMHEDGITPLSAGTYTTSIEKTNSSPVEYTVRTSFAFRGYYLADSFPAGSWDTETVNSVLYVYFDSYIETTAVYYGDNFNGMKSSVKTVDIWEISKVKKNGTPKYNAPLRLEYELHADYSNGNYNYRFLTPDGGNYNKLRDLYDIAQSGSFESGGIDNEVLFYYIRAVEMTVDNCSSVSASVSVPDPYLGRMSSLAYSYSGRKNITKSTGVAEFEFDGVNLDGATYDCVRITVAGNGDRSGLGVQLYYALNDTSAFIAENPSRREQKLIRMQQSYLQYDLISRS